MFFFPDGISLSCPDKVNIGKNFSIAANWLITPSELQQLSVNYDKSGALYSKTLEEFYLSNAGGNP
ncbi:hypothetical protein [Moorena sp. SIO4G3]|uniref:hypothetical protein n=1 Tax=Moorena sp. SIO4G3 TaxID=2607821 RepID=UPI0034173A8C